MSEGEKKILISSSWSGVLTLSSLAEWTPGILSLTASSTSACEKQDKSLYACWTLGLSQFWVETPSSGIGMFHMLNFPLLPFKLV